MCSENTKRRACLLNSVEIQGKEVDREASSFAYSAICGFFIVQGFATRF